MSLYQKMPVTKVFLDDEYLILGHADGTVRVYGAVRLNLITQVNLSAQTMHPATTKLNMGAVMQMPLKVSFIARHKDFIISTALEPDTRQLEMSIWALKGSYSVFPLRRRVIGGTVTCVHYDKTQNTVIVVTSIKPKDDVEVSMVRLRLEMKALTSSLTKWKSTNEADQVKLAEDLIQEVITNDLLYQVFMKLPFSTACSDVMAESLYTVLKENPERLKRLVDTALNYELDRLMKTKNALLSPASTSHSRPMSARNSKKALEDKAEKPQEEPKEASEASVENQEVLTTTAETSSDDSSDSSVSSDEDNSPRQSLKTPSSSTLKHAKFDSGSKSSELSTNSHWTQGCLSSSALSHYLVNRCHLFNFVALSDPLSMLAKADGKFVFTVDAVDETNPQNLRMLKRLTGIVSSIINNIIEKDMHLPRVAVDLLADFHARLRTAEPDAPELRTMKVGAGRLFVTHFILAAWLEPVKFGLTSKMPSDLNNLYAVAQLLEIVCLGGPDEVIGSVISPFKEELSVKFRTWFLSKLRNPERHIDAAKKKNSSFTLGGSSAVSSGEKSTKSSSTSKQSTPSRGATLVMIQGIIAYQSDIVTELTAMANGLELSNFTLGGPAWLRDIQTAGSSLLAYNSGGANAAHTALANVRAMNVAGGASSPTPDSGSPYSTAYSSPAASSSQSLVSGALSGRSAFKNTSSTMTPTDSTAAFVKTMSTYLLTPIQKMMNKEVLKDESVAVKLELFSEAQHALDGVSASGGSAASSNSLEASTRASVAFRADLDERRRESRPRKPLSVGSSMANLASMMAKKSTPVSSPRGTKSGEIPPLSLSRGSSGISSGGSNINGSEPTSGGRRAKIQRRAAHQALEVNLTIVSDLPPMLRQSPSAKAQLERSKIDSSRHKKLSNPEISKSEAISPIERDGLGAPVHNSTSATSLLNDRHALVALASKLGSSNLLDSSEASSTDGSDDNSSVSSNSSAASDEPYAFGSVKGSATLGRNAISLSRSAGRRMLRLASPSAPPIPAFNGIGKRNEPGTTTSSFTTPDVPSRTPPPLPTLPPPYRRLPAIASIFAPPQPLTYSTDSPADPEA